MKKLLTSLLCMIVLCGFSVNHSINHIQNRIDRANTGDVIRLGTYEQDGNISNGKEDIEWIVLKTEGNKALLVSKYALDTMPFNTDASEVKWDKSSINSWLNSDFLNTAFDSTEQSQIVPTSSREKVVLLTISEAERYFSSDSARQLKPTEYAKKMGVVTDENGNCVWWLCTSFFDPPTVCTVNSSGKVVKPGLYPDTQNIAIRPAIWININN